MFTAAAGDHLVFSVFLDTSDERYYLPFGINDDGYAKLVNTVTLAETTLFAASVSTLPNRGNTGWVSINYVIPAAGTYRLEFGVRNVGDAAGSVIMGVDSAPFTATITSVVAGEMHIHFTAMQAIAFSPRFREAPGRNCAFRRAKTRMAKMPMLFLPACGWSTYRPIACSRCASVVRYGTSLRRSRKALAIR